MAAILEYQTAKNQNAFMQRSLQVGTIPLRDFSSFIFCYFRNRCQLDWVYFYLILKQHNYERIFLTQIWLKSIQRLMRYCHFHVLRYFL